jgi:hypothetical protein
VTYPGTVYRYFSIDSLTNISGSPLKLSADAGVTFTITAEYVASPPATLPAIDPAKATAGWVRYWWRYLIGAGTSLPLTTGTNTIHGQLQDSPELVPVAWSFHP